MRKRFFLLLIATLTFTLANARQISKQEAQLKAEQFLGRSGQNYSNRKKMPRKTPRLTLANNHEELYVFNDKANGGYIVISGDDRMPDVLAYSYDGIYDDNAIPDNMKVWMDEYAGQVDYLRSHPKTKVKRQTATERENIAPLLTCWFNQSAPYNNKCPEMSGVHCVTGCVATAMAQIMCYYQWPKQTTDIIPGYTTQTHGISIPEQPITTIDWDNIRGDYGNNYSNEEADAVSTLMLLCGTSVKMEYSPNSSGASNESAALALRNYFGYDDMLEMVSRDKYNTSFYDNYYDDINKWEELIYEELNEKRPVYYCGYSEKLDAGHAFVMDGYEDGYFHVNWGWGGANSYVLMPDVGDFNLYHTIIVGIQPAYPNKPCQYAVLDNGKMTLYYDAEKEYRSGTVILHKDDWKNYKDDITECIIDSSFTNLKQRSLKEYFSNLSQLRSIEGVGNLRTDNVRDMSYMFSDCSSLESLDLSGFKTDNVRNMSCMFQGCSSLTSLDLSGFNTDNVTRMSCMFHVCSSLTSLDLSGFKTDNVTYMDRMFSGCRSFESLDLSSFKTNNVKTMGSMFSDCISLTSLNLSGFNTDNVTRMSYMFYDCNSLTSLDLSSFKTDNVTDMGYMFFNCFGLSSLDLSGFKTDNVNNMNSMFADCNNLTSLNLSSFKTDNVTNMSSMFSRCYSLTNLDLSSFKTDNVTDMSSMFANCNNLTSLDLSGFKTDNVTDMSGMFAGCNNLTSLDLSGFKTDSVTRMDHMFYYCSSLTSFTIPEGITSIGTRMFERCTGLESITIPEGVTSIGECAFQVCSNLTSIKVCSRTPIDLSMNTYTFSGIAKTVILYVPLGSKAAYQAADVWKEFKEIIEVGTDISQLDNAIYIEPFTVKVGDKVQMEICLKNAEVATAYVFDLLLPEGITVATNDKGKYIDELSDRHNDHTRTFNYKGENTYSLSTLSGNSEILTGNDGAIRLVTIKIPDDLAEGYYAIDIKNASYSKPDGTLVTLPDTRASVAVEDYVLGDVNGNGSVDIGDAVSIVNYLVGKTSSNFVAKAADTNKNGQIDIGDAVTIVNLLVGKIASLTRPFNILWDEREPE